MMRWYFLFLPFCLFGRVIPGVDCFFRDGHADMLKGKRVALVTNHTAVGGNLQPTAERFLHAPFTLVAIWTPEHGFDGSAYAEKKVGHEKFAKKIPVFSLYGDDRRPTKAQLDQVDVVVYDIQETGVRSYTYATTLFYVMEGAKGAKKPVIVLDRPNPINGLTMDGPMLKKEMRSFVGYVNVPYCHGMTIAELASFFNTEYQIHCDLKVVAMDGWKRYMSFRDTGLKWIPTSPQIPESDTPLYYATTGLIGELGIVSIGIGYTLPFKVVGAPWIDANKLAATLNDQNLTGVRFTPFHFSPFYGLYKAQNCHGVLIDVTDPAIFRPVTTQYMILGLIKSLYPKQFNDTLAVRSELHKDMFSKVSGNHDMLKLITNERYPAWKCITYQKSEREAFAEKRAKYLLY